MQNIVLCQTVLCVDLFNGTVMTSAADTSVDVDVEEDDTDTYGPAQYPLTSSGGVSKGE